jgi:IS1 family transposase
MKHSTALFWAKVAAPDRNGCRMWLGSLNRKGYGITSWGGRTTNAVRLAWKLAHGSIAPGLEADHWRLNEILLDGEQHLCSRRCVHHIRLVTRMENLHASPKVRATWALGNRYLVERNKAKTSCPAGHPYDEENTYVRPNGHRQCVRCRKSWQLRSDQKRKAMGLTQW